MIFLRLPLSETVLEKFCHPISKYEEIKKSFCERNYGFYNQYDSYNIYG